MKLQVKNEYGRLEKVLMARAGVFYPHPPINKAQEYWYRHDPPERDKLTEQQSGFAEVLERYGVEIIWAEQLAGCPNQINTRDIAFVAGDTFVVCRLKEEIRKEEVSGLEQLLKEVSTPVLIADEGIIEGGDIVIDNGVIYAGISSRSDYRGIGWLEKNFSGKFRVVPVELKSGLLHLDVVFNVIDKNTAIAYKEGIKNIKAISSGYEILEVDAKEQENLAVNTFTIEPGVIVVERRNTSIAQMLRSMGKQVELADYDEPAKIGGSFRCSTCPLIRS